MRQESALFQACHEDVEKKARDRIADLKDEMHGFYNEWQEVRADRHSARTQLKDANKEVARAEELHKQQRVETEDFRVRSAAEKAQRQRLQQEVAAKT